MGTVVALAAGEASRVGGLRIDVGLATVAYLPLLLLSTWHRLSRRGDLDASVVLFGLTLAAGIPYAAVLATDGLAQVLALAVLVVLLGAGVVVHERSALGAAAAGRRARRTGWGFGLRLLGAGLCALFAVVAAADRVEIDDVDCGTIPDALGDDPADERCGGEARMAIFGAVAFAGGGAYLAWSALQGAREPDEREQIEPDS